MCFFFLLGAEVPAHQVLGGFCAGELRKVDEVNGGAVGCDEFLDFFL